MGASEKVLNKMYGKFVTDFKNFAHFTDKLTDLLSNL